MHDRLFDQPPFLYAQRGPRQAMEWASRNNEQAVAWVKPLTHQGWQQYRPKGGEICPRFGLLTSVEGPILVGIGAVTRQASMF